MSHNDKISIFDLLIEIITKIENENKDKSEITINNLMTKLEDNVIALLMLILGLGCCVPFLYILPQIVSLPIIYLLFKLTKGDKKLWLPDFVGQRNLNIKELLKSANMAKKYLGWSEILIKPRMHFLNESKLSLVLSGLMLIPAISILVPLPLTNTVPGAAVVLYSIAYIQNDGFMKIVSVILGLAWVFGLIFLGVGFVDFLVNLL